MKKFLDFKLLLFYSVVFAVVVALGQGFITFNASSAVADTSSYQISFESAPGAGDGAIFSSKVLYDGTGHGTDSKCFLNSANGFTGPVDDGPNDGVACVNDTVAYSILYSFPSKTVDTEYTISLNLNSDNKKSIQGSSDLLNSCKSSNGIEATKVSTDNLYTATCKFKVKANNSISGNYDFYGTVKDGNKSYSPSVNISLSSGAPVATKTLNFSPVLFSGVVTGDFALDSQAFNCRSTLAWVIPDAAHPGYYKRANEWDSGAVKARSCYLYLLYYKSVLASKNVSSTKGLGTFYDSVKVDVNISGMRAQKDSNGNIINNSLFLEYTLPRDNYQDSRFRTITQSFDNNTNTLKVVRSKSAASNTPTIDSLDNSTYFDRTEVDFFIPAPQDNGTTTLNAKISGYNVDLSNYHYPYSFNLGKDEAGFNQNASYPTSSWDSNFVTKNYSSTISGTSDIKNNDYNRLSVSDPDNGLVLALNKNIYKDNNGTIGDLKASSLNTNSATSVTSPEEKVWNKLMISKAPASTNSVLKNNFYVCDSFYNQKTTDLSHGGQKLDTSRKIYSEYYNSGVLTNLQEGKDYTLYYRNNNSLATCSAIKNPDYIKNYWSITPNDNTGEIAVVFDNPNSINISGNANYPYSINVFIPTQMLSSDSYPNNYSNTDYYISDQGSLVYYYNNNSSVDTNAASLKILEPYRNITTCSEIYSDNSYCPFAGGNSSASVLSSGAYNLSTGSKNFYLRNIPSGETGTLVHKSTISSCALNLSQNQTPKLNSPFKDTVLVSSTIVPPSPGADGVYCTADDVNNNWEITDTYRYSVSDSEAKQSIDSNLTPGIDYRSFKFTVAPWADSSKSLTIGSTITMNPDGAASASGTSTKNIPISKQDVVGQTKTVISPREKVGNPIGWNTTFYNQKDTDVNGAEFIDILPYKGDFRNNKFTKPLNNISFRASGMPSGGKLYVTTKDPKTLVNDVRDSSNDPSNTNTWCEYGTTNCSNDGNWTAFYLNIPTFSANSLINVTINADTDNTSNGDYVINSLGIGNIQSINQPILAGLNQRIDLYQNSLSGYVYYDIDNSYAKDNKDSPISDWGVEAINSKGAVVSTTKTDSNGFYTFKGLDADDYIITVSSPTGVYSKVTQAYKNKDTGSTDKITLSDSSTIENVNFGLSNSPSLQVDKTVDKTNAAIGDTLKYTFVIKNNGNTPIELKDNTSFIDKICPNIKYDWGGNRGTDVTILDPDYSVTYQCSYEVTENDSDKGSVDNFVAIKAYSPGTDIVILDGTQPDNTVLNPSSAKLTDSVTTSIPFVALDLSIEKTGALTNNLNGYDPNSDKGAQLNSKLIDTKNDYLEEGDKVTWFYKVTNNSKRGVLKDYTVTDDKIGEVCHITTPLAAGDSYYCSKEGAITIASPAMLKKNVVKK